MGTGGESKARRPAKIQGRKTQNFQYAGNKRRRGAWLLTQLPVGRTGVEQQTEDAATKRDYLID